MSKASVVFLIHRLRVYRSEAAYTYTLLAIIGAWCLLSVFLVSFQCRLPEPWTLNPSNCPNINAYYYLIGAISIAIDFLLSLYVVPGIWRLNMGMALRSTVVALFASRLA